MDLSFYKDKTVLVTGHTGFKGTWLSQILIQVGANVIGYSLENRLVPNFFKLSQIEGRMTSYYGDIRDLESLKMVFEKHQPEVVFHLAAQALVRESYEEPVDTYSTNVMGTVNVLECIRNCQSVKSFVNVTTDKVYHNNDDDIAFIEEDSLDGFDPYSNSKSCSELVTNSYRKSFFQSRNIAISTARSGNVIGGGDFSKDRIIPDCYRWASNGEVIVVRNPDSTRPYQHVLETLRAYLLIASSQYFNKDLSGAYNIGPDQSDTLKTRNLVDLFCINWADNAHWISKQQESVHEANLLYLDHSKITRTLGWKPIWDAKDAIIATVQWYKAYDRGQNINEFMKMQIQEYFEQ